MGGGGPVNLTVLLMAMGSGFFSVVAKNKIFRTLLRRTELY
jgi:hypothetical protein